MSQLDTMALSLIALAVIGAVFAYQYKLSMDEKRWKTLILPALLLFIYLCASTAVTIVGNQYTAKEFASVDRFGNNLELTVQVPNTGNEYAGSFSKLRVYNAQHVLLDEIGLYFDDNVAADLSPSKAYEADVHKMLGSIKLDGVSQEQRYVLEGIGFLGITMTKNPFLTFAIPFGISIVLLLLIGFVSRTIQARKIRFRSINKIDIQSILAPQPKTKKMN